MNPTTTNLNSELLAADARGRKHVPVAVFAVILAHIILFLVLLIAAGCRAKERARLRMQALPEAAQMAEAGTQELGSELAAANASTDNVATPGGEEITALEEEAEPVETVQKAVQRTSSREMARADARVRTYTVQPGDTVEAIARRHGTTTRAIRSENNLKSDLIHPGQKLRVRSAGQGLNEV